MVNGSSRNVYLIHQNLTHLYGDYLERAVMVAGGPGAGRQGPAPSHPHLPPVRRRPPQPP
jgi:hypothetical protein